MATTYDVGGRSSPLFVVPLQQRPVLPSSVVSTETLAHAGKKARALIHRGVRRVFAVNVEKKRVLEWSRATNAWEMLAPDSVIDDPTLVAPLPLRALAEAVKADDAVAGALLAKKNPILESALASSAKSAKLSSIAGSAER